jgi:hypothetical protein
LLLLRLAEDLRVKHLSLLATGDPDADLLEVAVKDVLLVGWRFHPHLENVPQRHISHGNIFSDLRERITGGGRPLGRALIVQSVAQLLLLGHVLGMGPGHLG